MARSCPRLTPCVGWRRAGTASTARCLPPGSRHLPPGSALSARVFAVALTAVARRQASGFRSVVALSTLPAYARRDAQLSAPELMRGTHCTPPAASTNPRAELRALDVAVQAGPHTLAQGCVAQNMIALQTIFLAAPRLHTGALLCCSWAVCTLRAGWRQRTKRRSWSRWAGRRPLRTGPRAPSRCAAYSPPPPPPTLCAQTRALPSKPALRLPSAAFDR